MIQLFLKILCSFTCLCRYLVSYLSICFWLIENLCEEFVRLHSQPVLSPGRVSFRVIRMKWFTEAKNLVICACQWNNKLKKAASGRNSRCASGLWSSSQYLFCHQCYFASELKTPQREQAEQMINPQTNPNWRSLFKCISFMLVACNFECPAVLFRMVNLLLNKVVILSCTSKIFMWASSGLQKPLLQ